MIYLIKWPDGTANMIKAASKNAAWLIADSLGDPTDPDCEFVKVEDREWMIGVPTKPDYTHEYTPEALDPHAKL